MEPTRPYELNFADDTGANTAEYSIEQLHDLMVKVMPRHDGKSSGARNTVQARALVTV